MLYLPSSITNLTFANTNAVISNISVQNNKKMVDIYLPNGVKCA